MPVMDGCLHSLIVVYRRPWYAPWRRVLVLRCFLCDFREDDPLSGSEDSGRWRRGRRGI